MIVKRIKPEGYWRDLNPSPPPSPTAKKFNNVKNVQAMTTKRFLGTFLFLGTFQSRLDVYVNIDVTRVSVLAAMFSTLL